MSKNTNLKNQVLSFKTTKAEAETIAAIVDRAMKMVAKEGIDYNRMTCNMDITACHANGNPIDLKKLLGADDFNFFHDVFGIRRHINRETGKLENCFSPRCSAKRLTQ